MDAWLDPDELRVGLGCMRLGEDGEATIAAALDAGVTVFDTARAYDGSERLVGRALRGARARVVTKGGMTRVDGAWIPDGRARAIRADCEASLAALGGLPIDLYLLHAPDPRVPWATSVRALARLVEERLVARVGLANVNRRQLDEALEVAPLAAVQVALGLHDDHALRGGVVERCEETGVTLIAHSPLGGPRRARRLAHRSELREVADAHGATPSEVALAWLLALSPVVVAIPGATRPETARSGARAAALALDERELALIRPPRAVARPSGGAEVVLVVGIQGAGKTRLAEEYVGRGYSRLNRDERGGTLRGLAQALEAELAAGARRIVVDSTYLTRAARSYVVDAARGGARIRCVWLDTPLAQAQVNLVERLLDRLGRLPQPDELRALARREPGLLAPTSQMRSVRELEPPSADEGFEEVERVPFVRAPRGGRVGVFVAAAALERPGWERTLAEVAPGAPHLVFDWRPGGGAEDLASAVERVASEVAGPVDAAVCPHPAGPPVCWCRPPLPGLPLAFARAHAVDPSRSVLVGTGPAHRTLAGTLGARYVLL